MDKKRFLVERNSVFLLTEKVLHKDKAISFSWNKLFWIIQQLGDPKVVKVCRVKKGSKTVGFASYTKTRLKQHIANDYWTGDKNSYLSRRIGIWEEDNNVQCYYNKKEILIQQLMDEYRSNFDLGFRHQVLNKNLCETCVIDKDYWEDVIEIETVEADLNYNHKCEDCGRALDIIKQCDYTDIYYISQDWIEHITKLGTAKLKTFMQSKINQMIFHRCYREDLIEEEKIRQIINKLLKK